MYNKLRKLSFLVFAPLAILSCSSDIADDVSEKTLQMNAVLESFQPSGQTSRTVDSGYETSFSANDKVGIIAVTSDGKVPAECNNLSMTFNGTSWSGSTIPGIDGARYFAYYPYTANVSANASSEIVNGWKGTNDQSTHEKYANNDLLVASEITPSNNTLNFTFKHQMSMIEVNLPEECLGNEKFTLNNEQVKMWNVSGKTFRYLTSLTGDVRLDGSFSVDGKTAEFSKDNMNLARGTYYKLRVKYDPEIQQYVTLDLTGFDNDVNIDGSATYSLVVSPSSLRFASEPSNAETLTIVGNDTWEASSSQSWLKLSKTSGSGNATIDVTANNNTTTSSRSATITVKGKNTNKTITVQVTQEAGGTTSINTNGFDSDQNIDGQASYTLSCNASNLYVDSQRNTASINVTSNDSWTVTSSKTSWCTVSPSSGNGNGSFTITVAENTTSSKRDAVITVKGTASGKTAIITLTQEAGGQTSINKDGFSGDVNIDK